MHPPHTPQALRHRQPRRLQRGMVTAIVVLLLIATVVVALSQMLQANTGNQVQVQHHGESDKAFFIAESGLEAARQRLAILLGARFTNLSCTGIAASFTNVPLGDGQFSITSAVPTPSVCDSAGGTPCTDCALTSVGTVGLHNRSISFGVNLSATNGVSCNSNAGNCRNDGQPLNWRLDLVNTYATPSVAVFNLAARRQGAFTAANCPAGVPCNLQWYVQAQNGGSSVGSMGNAVVLTPDGTVGSNYKIYQTLNEDFSIAEVGALFPGTGAGPSLTAKFVAGVAVEGSASYWKKGSGGSGGTVGKTADSSGWTNNGSADDPTVVSCTTATSADEQLCTNWCHGGDTLVYGFSGEASSGAESLSAVTFNSGAGGQNIPMTRVARYTTNIPSPNAAGNVYSEIWFARNSDYLSVNTATTGATFNGTAGTTFTANFNNNSSLMTVTSAPVTGPALGPGDVVRCVNGCTAPAALVAGTAIINQITPLTGGEVLGGRGRYNLTANCTNPGCGNNVVAGVARTSLTVTGLGAGQSLGLGDTVTSTGTGTNITPGTTITAVPGGGSSSTANGLYTLSSTQLVTGRTMNVASANVRVTGGTSVPAPGTLLAVRSGTGALQSQTRVAASPAPTATDFWLDKVPTTQLSGATLCGGTCAFFNQASASTTPFTIAKSAGTGYWSSGFTCLKGADVTPEVVNSATTTSKRWTENVAN